MANPETAKASWSTSDAEWLAASRRGQRWENLFLLFVALVVVGSLAFITYETVAPLLQNAAALAQIGKVPHH